MIEVLSQFSKDEIEHAFRVWQQESENLPTPKGILDIIRRRHRHLRDMQTPDNPELSRPRCSKYDDLPQAEQKHFDKCFSQAKAYLGGA
ncbi:MAG: hypothetical protein ACRBCK_10030 [Alphaproteobacteria bacterium]